MQYFTYMSNLVQGDLGFSIRTDSPVSEDIGRYYLNTLELASLSMLFALVISLPVGIFSAIRRGAFTERIVFLFSMLGITAPAFWIALILQLIFAVKLKIFHTSGFTSFSDLILPAITLAAYPLASLVRQIRAAMLEVLSEDFVRTAHAKGLRPFRIYFRHALTNALIPIVTMAGYQFAMALGGAIIAETVFAYPGIGRYLVLSISARDYPAIQSTVLILAITYVAISFLTDLSYHLIDPRIVYE
jgi:ABC-type dipeptide/oligopeptide/nickel transport system permease component